MTRTVDATLQAAAQAGQGKMIATGYIGYSDGSVSVSGPVSQFKLTGTTLQFTIASIATFAGDQTHMWLKRGLNIAGTDYTITTGRFAIHDQKYLPNKTQILTGGLFPNTYYSASGYASYDTVINAFCTAYGKTAVYRETGEAWHAYKFLGVGKNVLLNSAMSMLNVLQQKRLIQMCDIGSEQVLVFCTDVYGSTDLSIAIKDEFSMTHTLLLNRQFIWQDELGVYHQDGTATNPIHNLGYMESTDSPPARHSATHLFRAVLRPDLRILDGDRVSFTAWGTTSSSMFARITEEFDAATKGAPQWRTIVESNTVFNNTEAGQTTTNIERTANYIPVSTSHFVNHLSDKDSNLQHALDTLDDTRETLTKARTYYVRTDGNDANSGRANSAAGAFLTLQAAWNAAKRLDFNGYDVTVQVADGTYTTGLAATGGLYSGGSFIIDGNHSTPANVLLEVTNNDAIYLDSPIPLVVQYFKIHTITSGHHIEASGALTKLTIGTNMNFGAAPTYSSHIVANGGVLIYLVNNYTISGNCWTHINVTVGCRIVAGGNTITLSGTPAWGATFISASMGSVCSFYATTYSGASTGKRYVVDLNAVIQTYGGTTVFPGNAAGTTATGGQYA